MTYGLDVIWQAHEIDTYRIYSHLCAEQAMAIFHGDLSKPIPAQTIAARARMEALTCASAP